MVASCRGVLPAGCNDTLSPDASTFELAQTRIQYVCATYIACEASIMQMTTAQKAMPPVACMKYMCACASDRPSDIAQRCASLSGRRRPTDSRPAAQCSTTSTLHEPAQLAASALRSA